MNGKICTNLFLVIFFVLPIGLCAQTTQTLRGQLTGNLLQEPVAGATVTLPALNRHAVTDEKGNFRFEKVPLGNQQLQITHKGYQDIWMENINLIAGKEMVLAISMQAAVREEQEVIVQAKRLRTKPLNDLSLVSARTFSVEETQRYAAAVNDPLRMATSFAGVMATDDGGNNVSIRGNSPNGLLWRMEGVDIPNPNHFASAGSSGGGISILSSQLLSTSDFVTAAFAAEYGNALGGVFDLHLRKGNDEKREYAAQVGVLGLNLAAEGPFSKNYKGSYLINYRLSTLQLLGMMGVDIGAGTTDFQDLSYHINLPAGKAGTFSLFGFWGKNAQHIDTETDPGKWEKEWDRYGGVFSGHTAVTGITHQVQAGKKLKWKSSLAYSVQANKYDQRYAETPDSLVNTFKESYSTKKWIMNTGIQYQLNQRQSLRAGIIFSQIGFNYLQNSQENPGEPVLERINAEGNTQTLQGFAQWEYRISPQVTATAGLHYLQLLLNNSASLEPRAALRWEPNKRNSFSIGYGLHSQLQPMGVYFAKVQNAEQDWTTPNTELGLSKSHHFVLSYSRFLGKGLRLRAEAYYQHLFNVPISTYDTSSFSTLNVLQDFVTEPLVGNGKGRNYGLELSLEKQLRQNFYFLFSNSFYQSKYTAADGIERSTRFNGNIGSTLTAGKEFVHPSQRRSFGFNLKLMYMGGYCDTPIDLPGSISSGYTKYIESEAFSQQMPAYFRTDFRFSFKWNRSRTTSTVSLDVQNLTNRQNIYGRSYDPLTGKVVNLYLTGIIPVFNYKIEF